jgi:hypothetical protein
MVVVLVKGWTAVGLRGSAWSFTKGRPFGEAIVPSLLDPTALGSKVFAQASAVARIILAQTLQIVYNLRICCIESHLLPSSSIRCLIVVRLITEQYY